MLIGSAVKTTITATIGLTTGNHQTSKLDRHLFKMGNFAATQGISCIFRDCRSKVQVIFVLLIVSQSWAFWMINIIQVWELVAAGIHNLCSSTNENNLIQLFYFMPVGSN